MLVAALEEAHPGDRILFANYGDGCDAFILGVTEEIARVREKPMMKERLVKKRSIDYGTYLNWRDLVPFEPSSLPERAEPSLATRWRERKDSFAPVRGEMQEVRDAADPPDRGRPSVYAWHARPRTNSIHTSFPTRRAASSLTRSTSLQPTKNPPGLNGVVDFDGGGRLICELDGLRSWTRSRSACR